MKRRAQPEQSTAQGPRPEESQVVKSVAAKRARHSGDPRLGEESCARCCACRGAATVYGLAAVAPDWGRCGSRPAADWIGYGGGRATCHCADWPRRRERCAALCHWLRGLVPMPPGLALAGRAQRHVPHPAPSAQTPMLIHPHPHPTPIPPPPQRSERPPL